MKNVALPLYCSKTSSNLFENSLGPSSYVIATVPGTLGSISNSIQFWYFERLTVQWKIPTPPYGILLADFGRFMPKVLAPEGP